MQGEKALRIWDCETGNPPEGWESAGQLRIEKPGARSQEKEGIERGDKSIADWEMARKGK